MCIAAQCPSVCEENLLPAFAADSAAGHQMHPASSSGMTCALVAAVCVLYHPAADSFNCPVHCMSNTRHLCSATLAEAVPFTTSTRVSTNRSLVRDTQHTRLDNPKGVLPASTPSKLEFYRRFGLLTGTQALEMRMHCLCKNSSQQLRILAKVLGVYSTNSVSPM